jgi:hypothetical protein
LIRTKKFFLKKTCHRSEVPKGQLKISPAQRAGFASQNKIRPAAVAAVRSAAFTPLQFTRISTRRKFPTLSSILPLKRPEGRAPFPSRRDEPEIARRFNAGCKAQKHQSPAGTTDFFGVGSAVPAGLGQSQSRPGVETPGYFHAVPAGTIQTERGCVHRGPVAAHPHAKIHRKFFRFFYKVAAAADPAPRGT